MADTVETDAADGRPAWLEYGTALVRDLVESDAAGLSEAHARFRTSLTGDADFSVIAENCSLRPDEADVLAVLAASEFDPSLAAAVGTIQGSLSKNRLTLGTLGTMFAAQSGHVGVLAVADDGALRRSGFVTVVPDGPWSDAIVALHPTVVWAIVGDASADPDLPLTRSMVRADDPSGADVVVISGAGRLARRQAAVEATRGDHFLAVDVPSDVAGWAAVAREATLTGSGVIIEVGDTALDAAGRGWIERAAHLRWAISSDYDMPVEDLPARPWIGIRAETAMPDDAAWSAAFGDDIERTHPLTTDQLPLVARAFHSLDGDLDAAVRRIVSGRLDEMSERIRPTRTWSDLVVSETNEVALRSIVSRYRHADQVFGEWQFADSSSTGTVVLFAGPSGTGKTLSAEVIAADLGLDVFKLDLAAVVSKYIGETEKNLDKVFDAAKSGNLVLFFDEADALFGKRSEVRDARDRYANIEVSYLLQRLESYDGLVVLATNFEKNMDEAFLRRIHVRVAFELPEAAQRAKIWRSSVVSNAPVENPDFDDLAERFEISGGIIRNAAVHAAFLAAVDGQPITTERLVSGVASEYRKLGRLIQEETFGPYFEMVSPPESATAKRRAR